MKQMPDKELQYSYDTGHCWRHPEIPSLLWCAAHAYECADCHRQECISPDECPLIQQQTDLEAEARGER